MVRTPYKEFIEIARSLNKTFDVAPVLYGSLGLEAVTGARFDPQDIDVLVPAVYLGNRWEELMAAMERSGYVLKDLHEHEFVKDGMVIAFAEEEDLVGFAGIDARSLAVIDTGDVRYRTLALEDYLKVYQRCLTDGYRRERNNGKDILKIERIKHLLANGREAEGLFRPAMFGMAPLQKFLLFIIATAVLSGAYYFFGGPPRPTPSDEMPPRIDVLEEPEQIMLEEKDMKVLYERSDGFRVLALAEYRIAGVVLSTSVNQRYGGESIYPIDIGLIWGKPARSNYPEYLTYRHARNGMSETNRTLWVSYKEELPAHLTDMMVMDHISNSHVFPANRNIYNAVAHLEEGEDVILEGYLLRTVWSGPGGFTKDSSLSRTDRDCEDLYVRRVITTEGVFE